MKHTYSIARLYNGEWYSLIKGECLQYCLGWLDRASSSSPRPAYRLVRSDGKVLKLIPEREDVSIGQVAGFPTAEQYERAAEDALKRAAVIREHEQMKLEQIEARRRAAI